jgi:hypothetical protein
VCIKRFGEVEELARKWLFGQAFSRCAALHLGRSGVFT